MRNPLKKDETKTKRISQIEKIEQWGYKLETNEDARERRVDRENFLLLAQTFRCLDGGKPDKLIEKMMETLEKMDALLKKNSVPWGRAGTMNRGSTANWYAMMMGAYEEIMGLFTTDLAVIHSLIVERKDYDMRFKHALVGHMRNTAIEEIIPRMKQVEDYSWLDQDMTGKFNYLIQSQVVPGRSQGTDIDKEAMKL